MPLVLESVADKLQPQKLSLEEYWVNNNNIYLTIQLSIYLTIHLSIYLAIYRFISIYPGPIPHQARPDRHSRQGGRQDRRSQLPDRSQAVRG